MEEKEFRLLTLREERALTLTELEAYYADLRKYVLERPLKTTTKGH